MTNLVSLCIHIATQKYGKNAGTLTEVLLTHGELCIGDIRSLTLIEAKKLRQLMMVFFKIGFIVQSEKNPGNFLISTGAILDHSRDVTYLSFINHRFGQVSQSIVKTLMLNGTMDFADCVDQTMEFYQLASSEKAAGVRVTRAQLETEFANLEKLGYFTKINKKVL